ncbi:MAG: restriction endonuclease subunit S [Pseudoalteromonas distincta]|uniref:restriction endonuclease subunit S n=1 Tax=Pseudoalteromonas distincta TaxID=77608 RepID=UPI003F9BD59A
MNSEFERHTLSKLVHIDQKSLGKKTPEDYTFSYISLSDVSSGNISKTLEKHSFKSAPSRARRVLQNGDIIMATVRPNLQGFAKITEEFSHCVASTGFAVLSPKDNVSGEFIYQCLYSYQIAKQIESLVVGSNYPAINSSDVAGLHIYTPPYPEQRKIATILGTWDKAISTTVRLIDNSKRQKKALMQQLLTGKKRLLDDSGKPFEGEWEEVKLGEISHITTGSSNREDSSLDGEYTFFDRSEDIRKSSRYLFDSEAVIVPGEGQDFVPKHFEGKFDLHQRTYAIMNFDGCVGRFLFYYIGYHRHYFLAQAVGSTVKSLRLPMFQKMPINLPNQLEQAKIASVLNNADGEIKILQQQLADLKQEKKALMQQLLTGKRRVKVDDKEVA